MEALTDVGEQAEVGRAADKDGLVVEGVVEDGVEQQLPSARIRTTNMMEKRTLIIVSPFMIIPRFGAVSRANRGKRFQKGNKTGEKPDS